MPDGYIEYIKLPDENGWSKTIDNLARGEYRIAETTAGYITSYELNGGPSIDGRSALISLTTGSLDQSIKLTNKQMRNMTVTGTKIWSDDAPADKPAIWFQLIRVDTTGGEIRIGSPREVIGDSVTWEQTDADVDPDAFVRIDESGYLYEYKVLEVDANGEDYVPSGYTKTEDGLTVTNSRTPETVDVEGSKTWRDQNNQDGKRPNSIIVRLYMNGSEYDWVEVSEEDGWAWSFTHLPKYEDGVQIVYAIDEDEVEDYTAEVDGYDITNRYTPNMTDITVTKVWDDMDNRHDFRPNDVTILLYANGEDTGLSPVLNVAMDWTDKFTDLPAYENGQEILYIVIEAEVKNYKSEITGDSETGFTVTNRLMPSVIPPFPSTGIADDAFPWLLLVESLKFWH